MPLFRPRSIEELKTRGDVPALVEAVVNPDHRQIPTTPSGPGVDAITARNTAIKALWALRTPESLAALISLLDQPDEHLRKTIVSPLEVGLVTPEAFDLLVRGARDPSGWVRRSAIWEICNLDDERVVPLLLGFLEDQDRNIRLSTVSGIEASISATSHWGTKPPREIAAALAQLAMHDPDGDVRKKAFEAVEKTQQIARSNDTTAEKRKTKPNIERLTSKRDVEGLRSALRYEDFADLAGSREVRRAAAAALGKLGNAAGVESLIGALDDDDPEMKKEVVHALATIGDPRAVAPLVEMATSDTEPEVRATAAEALGDLGDAEAVPVLLQVLREGYAEPRLKAAETLGKLNDSRAVEPLIDSLRDRDDRVLYAAAEALGKLSDARSVEPLIATIAKPHMNDDARGGVGRARAVAALGRFRDPRSFNALVAALSERSYAIRAAAAYALGNLGDIRALDALLRAASDDGASVRAAAIAALGELGDDRAVDSVIWALRDDDEEDVTGSRGVRWAAVEALGKIGGERAADALVGKLVDKDLSYKALETLKGLGAIPFDKIRATALLDKPLIIGAAAPLEILVSEQDWDEEFAEVLFHRMTEVRAVLEEDAHSASLDQDHYRAAPTVRQNYKTWLKAAEAYFGVGNLDRLDTLEADHTKRLEELEQQQRAAEEKHRQRLEELERKRLAEEQERERQANDPSFQTAALVDAARTSDWKTRDRAAKNLVRLGSSAVPALVQALSDSTLEVRWSAADVLGRIGDRAAVDALAKLLDDDKEGVRDIAEQALEAIGGPNAERFLASYRAAQP